MTDPRGILKVRVGSDEYVLYFGMSGIAEMQAKHGQDVLQKLDPPEDAGDLWVPDFEIFCDLFKIALSRYHPDLEAGGKYVADELFRHNPMLASDLLLAAMPEQQAASGNGRRPKRTA